MRTLGMAVLLLLVAGCSTAPRPYKDVSDVPDPGGEGYLSRGPTTSLDLEEDPPQEGTALQMLKEKSARVTQLQEELAAVRSSLQDAAEARRKAEKEAAAQTGRADRLEQELERLLAYQQDVNERLLDALIRVRELEKELLTRKLAELARTDH